MSLDTPNTVDQLSLLHNNRLYTTDNITYQVKENEGDQYVEIVTGHYVQFKKDVIDGGVILSNVQYATIQALVGGEIVSDTIITLIPKAPTPYHSYSAFLSSGDSLQMNGTAIDGYALINVVGYNGASYYFTKAPHITDIVDPKVMSPLNLGEAIYDESDYFAFYRLGIECAAICAANPYIKNEKHGVYFAGTTNPKC
ncbi:hypothetical protein FACS1894166_01110 [Bacilli bacterium]|nr:hypothetical protein FACS1894166_01110 [Bacilli bacterium]